MLYLHLVRGILLSVEVYADQMLGWCLPWVWAGIGAIISVVWTKRMLKIEQDRWTAPQA